MTFDDKLAYLLAENDHVPIGDLISALEMQAEALRDQQREEEANGSTG